MSLLLTIAILIFLVFMLLGSGLYVGLGLAGVGVLGIELLADMGETVGAVMFNAINNYPLAAIPFFIFMGNIVLHTGISRRLYRGVSQWTRIIPGSLAHSNIVSCAIFAAVSGSSAATAATIGTVAYGQQIEKGYDASLVTGSLAAGGTLGILIPPSINMIVYGAFVGASVGRLFAGGIVPGAILVLMFMVYIAFASVIKRSLAPPRERVRSRYFLEAVIALKDIWPMFLLMATIMGGIYAGIMTPTEAATVSAFLALILGATVGKLDFAIVKNSALAAIRTSAMIFLIFVGASLLGTALGLLRIPAELAKMVAGWELGPLGIWFGVVVLYLILGCLMDTLAMLLVTLPVTYPLVVIHAGWDPIWFGVQAVVLCEIGLLTPPIGINLFVIHGIAEGTSLETIIRGTVPFFLMMLVALVIFTYVPDLILFLPSRMFGG